jgi:hypothetical protein
MVAHCHADDTPRMTDFSALTPGTYVSGLAASGLVEVLAVEMHGTSAATVTWADQDGRTDRRVIYGDVLAALHIVESGRRWAFTADAADFLLASEAQRLRLAYLFDAMLAVHTSAVQPLPHQIRAVYGEMLPRQPLRFLLADDPGAGKTIMAGLLIKEPASGRWDLRAHETSGRHGRGWRLPPLIRVGSSRARPHTEDP